MSFTRAAYVPFSSQLFLLLDHLYMDHVCHFAHGIQRSVHLLLLLIVGPLLLIPWIATSSLVHTCFCARIGHKHAPQWKQKIVANMLLRYFWPPLRRLWSSRTLLPVSLQKRLPLNSLNGNGDIELNITSFTPLTKTCHILKSKQTT